MSQYALYVSTEGLTQAQVLCALYNAASPFTDHREANPRHVMSLGQAKRLLRGPLKGARQISTYRGRNLMVTFGNGFVDVEVYDQYNGDQQGEKALARIAPAGSVLVTRSLKGEPPSDVRTWQASFAAHGRFQMLEEHRIGNGVQYY